MPEGARRPNTKHIEAPCPVGTTEADSETTSAWGNGGETTKFTISTSSAYAAAHSDT